MYTIAELVKAARNLGYSPLLVEAALKRTGKKKFELDEALAIIKEFAEKKV